VGFVVILIKYSAFIRYWIKKEDQKFINLKKTYDSEEKHCIKFSLNLVHK